MELSGPRQAPSANMQELLRSIDRTLSELKKQLAMSSCKLATQACRQEYSARYFRSFRLLEALSVAHGDGRFAKQIAQIAKTDVLSLDNFGIEYPGTAIA